MRISWQMRIVISVFISWLNLSAQPDTLWTKTYGGIYSDIVRCVQVTSDGGYIMTGSTASYGAGDMDVYVIKTDSLGDTLWTKVYGSPYSDRSEWIECTTDSGYIVAGGLGYSVGNLDIWLLKINIWGDTLWTKIFGGVNWDGPWSVRQTHDNGYIVCGKTESYGAGWSDVWLIKTDSAGDSIWTKTYGGIHHDYGYSTIQTRDYGYLIAGCTYSYGAGQSDAWLIKTDSLGNDQWTKTYGGTNYDFVYEMAETQDHGYFISGMTQSFGSGNSDAWFIRIDSLGDTLWTKTYGDTGYEYAESGVQTADGGYIACGYKSNNWIYDLWIIKLDSLGNLMWTKLLGHSEHDYGQSIRQTPDLGYICAGHYDIAGSSDIWLIRLASESGIADDFSYCPTQKHDIISVTPNPFRDKTDIRLKIADDRLPIADSRWQLNIYNVAGFLVKSFRIAHNVVCPIQITWNGADEQGNLLSPGVYFCCFKSNMSKAVVSRKLVLLK